MTTKSPVVKKVRKARTKKLYRLELDPQLNLHKNGIYHIDGDTENALRKHGVLDQSITHPLPYDDSLLLKNTEKYNREHNKCVEICDIKGSGKWRFGFNSIAQLRRWFYSDDLVRDLQDTGIFLSVYEADIIITGNTQSVMPSSFHCAIHLRSCIPIADALGVSPNTIPFVANEDDDRDDF